MKKQILAALLGAVITAGAFQLAWPEPVTKYAPEMILLPITDPKFVHPPYEKARYDA
jgi:hypothetical protein